MFRFLFRLEVFFCGRACFCLFLAFAIKPPDLVPANGSVGMHFSCGRLIPQDCPQAAFRQQALPGLARRKDFGARTG